MEHFTLDQNIPVAYVAAGSFPDGITAAHEQLHARVPFSAERRYFGLSRPENGPIQYKAAAEELQPGEAARWNCPSMIIKKGTYIALTIENYTQDLQSIGRAFRELLTTPGLDPQGYCVEWYLNGKDVRCMIRLEA